MMKGMNKLVQLMTKERKRCISLAANPFCGFSKMG